MEQGIYKAIVDRMTFSYSRLSSFSDCRYGWFLKYIDCSEEQDMFYASYGKFIHSILERFYKNELEQDEMVSTFLQGFSTEVKGQYPSESIVASYVEKGLEYFRNFKPLDMNILGVEKQVEFKVSGYNLIGFIDLLGEKDGELYIVDNKSRELKPRSKKNNLVRDRELDDMLKQLYIYSEAVYQEFGKYPKSLCFNCFKNGVFIEEPFDIETHKKTLDWVIEQINKIKNAKDFYPALDYFKCKYLCGVHNECCYFN